MVVGRLVGGETVDGRHGDVCRAGTTIVERCFGTAEAKDRVLIPIKDK